MAAVATNSDKTQKVIGSLSIFFVTKGKFWSGIQATQESPLTRATPTTNDHSSEQGHTAPAVLVTANTAWNLANFRAPIIRALIQNEYRVVAAAPVDSAIPELQAMGVEFEPIAVDARGLSPPRDLALVFAYRRLLRRVAPAAMLTFTPKPNIYGSLAAELCGVPAISTVTGLGTGFLSGRALQSFVSILYRLAFRSSACVFFHNREDLELFAKNRLVDPGKASVVAGSGIDIYRFKPVERKRTDGPPTFLFVGRFLKDKGLAEFIAAAADVGSRHPGRFQLAGVIEEHPKAVSRELVENAARSGIVELVGTTTDIREFIEDADCVVLPSYREGLPRVLLEASAMAKPVIAADVPGCRQAVDHRLSGLLCEPRSARALAEAMETIMAMSPGQRTEMGRQGRMKAEREFSEERVVEAYLDALREVTA